MGFAIAVNVIKDAIAEITQLNDASNEATMCELFLYNDNFNTRERVSRVLQDVRFFSLSSLMCPSRTGQQAARVLQDFSHVFLSVYVKHQ